MAIDCININKEETLCNALMMKTDADFCNNKCFFRQSKIKRSNVSRGVGDTVKKVIDTVTLGKVHPCSGCKKRQERLNKLMPYKGENNG